jgi:hypothetical protein
MTPSTRTRKSRRKPVKPTEELKLPLSVTNREGKTTIRKYVDRHFVRMNEIRGKTVAYVELYTSKQDSHSLTIRFTDKTRLALGISPGFTINAELYRLEGLGDPTVLKRWPEMRSEQLP